MGNSPEIRIDKSKVTHLIIKIGYNGIDTGWGVKQYKFCEATYRSLFGFKWKKTDAGYYRDGKQSSSFLSPIYEKDEVEKNEEYMIFSGWVFTKTRVFIYIGSEMIKVLYFDGIESAEEYCRTNFTNVKFII